MIAVDAEARRRWAVAACSAVVAVALAVSIFRAPTIAVPDRPPVASGPRVLELKSVTAADASLSEATTMRDLTPLFLPTERNASAVRVPRREPGQTFLDVETPNFGIAVARRRLDEAWPAVVTMNGKRLDEAKPLDLLAAAEVEPSVAGFGRAPIEVLALRSRGVVVEVVNLRDGRRIVAEELDVRPTTASGWEPMEFMAAVGPAGLIGPLTTSVSSGVEEIDGFLRNYLARSYRLGERLAPGFYRITVTP